MGLAWKVARYRRSNGYLRPHIWSNWFSHPCASSTDGRLLQVVTSNPKTCTNDDKRQHCLEIGAHHEPVSEIGALSGRSSFRRKGSRLPKQWRREISMATFITVLGSLNCQVWFNHWTLDRQPSSNRRRRRRHNSPCGGYPPQLACEKKT